MEGLEALGIGVLRISIGVVFTAHGVQKLLLGFADLARNMAILGVPAPDATAVAATLIEFAGGLLLITGLFTRPAAILTALEMAGSIFAVHFKNGFFLPHGFEYPLSLLAASIALALTGPGALALDAKVVKNRIF